MTYQELRDEIQVLIDAAQQSEIVRLMTPETSALVRGCDEALLKPEDQYNTKSLAQALYFYEVLTLGLAGVVTVDAAVQWFNSTNTYAAIAGLGFDVVTPVVLDELERLDIIGQEKIFDACL